MGRNAQLIRQWAILKQIETNRWTTISDMAEHHIVSTKTIRRDLAALMEAGFPLYDERYDGKVYWRLNEEYKGLPLATLSLGDFGLKIVRFFNDLFVMSLVGCYLGPIFIWVGLMFRGQPRTELISRLSQRTDRTESVSR